MNWRIMVSSLAMVTTMNAIDRGDYWELPLKGEAIARCYVDTAFGLEFGINKRKFLLSIEGNFSITSSGKRIDFSMEHRESLGPSLALYGKTVQSCRAAKSGVLDIEFTDGTALHIEPNDKYEAWELGSGAHGLRMVCGPGGLLSIWQPSVLQ